MIPKTIHYCWFGPKEKSVEIKKCIQSWRDLCPDYTIKEWSEKNFNIESSSFVKKMHQEKKWAFVADYVRLHALLNEGGIYLDTDMLLVKPLDEFLQFNCVLGEESSGIISAGMIASERSHPFIKSSKDFYDSNSNELITIPRALTKVYESYEDRGSIKVLPPRTFYPFDAEHIHEFCGQDLGEEVYGVHLWHYSWGHPVNKFFKKIGVYRYGKKMAEKLGIKMLLKRILGFI